MAEFRSDIGLNVGFPDDSMVNNLHVNVGDAGSTPGLGRSPGEGNGIPPCIFAWEIPWLEEPGRLKPWGHKRV